MRDDGGVAGEGRIFGVLAMPLTNINSDWMSNLACVLAYIISSITAPEDAHKLVLEVAGWLTASLSGLARHELTT